MKLFKRFAAALLVGVMALAMLTACGGGAGGAAKTDAEKFEDVTVKSYALAMGKTDLTNDSTLKSKATSYLVDTLDEEGKVKDGKKSMTVSEADTEGNVIVISIAVDEHDAVQPIDEASLKATANTDGVAEAMAAKVKAKMGEELLNGMKENIQAMGVSVVKIGDKYYMAAAIKAPKVFVDEMTK